MVAVFPFLIGKVLTKQKDLLKSKLCLKLFPFLIGKVLTDAFESITIFHFMSLLFPFLIGKVLTRRIQIL